MTETLSGKFLRLGGVDHAPAEDGEFLHLPPLKNHYKEEIASQARNDNPHYVILCSTQNLIKTFEGSLRRIKELTTF
ncbi:MAG: hypothetical protein J5I50_07595 [Chitinophagaceae bacterium]|nr:hypothetical protein [Chitinophagaceae bacterium]